MRTFKRVHHTGTVAIVTEHTDGWHSDDYDRLYGAHCAELAKAVADKEVAKYGHVCNAVCKDWG